MNEPRNDGPQWVPYQPPPPRGRERVWVLMRRASFPVVLLLFVVGLGALFYLSSEDGAGQQAMHRLFGTEEEAPSIPSSIPPDGSTGLGAGEAGDAQRERALDLGLDTATAGEEADARGAGYANLSVFSEPSGATVLVDSDSIGVTPVNRHALRSGVYIITVHMDGFFSADTVAILRSAQAPIYSVTLDPRPERPEDEQPALAARQDGADRLTQPPLSEEAPSSADVPTSDTPATALEEEVPAPDPLEPEAAETSEQETSPVPDTMPSDEAPEPVPATGTLRFTSEPTDARVTLDGEVVGTTPLTLNAVEAGAYEVAVTRRGYDTLRTEVTLAPQEERDVQAALNPLAGRLRVLVQPWGSIYVDGQLHERNADVRYETQVPAGEHEVEAVHPSLGRQMRTVTVGPGEQVSLTIDLRTSSDPDGP